MLCKFFQGRDEKRFLSHVRARCVSMQSMHSFMMCDSIRAIGFKKKMTISWPFPTRSFSQNLTPKMKPSYAEVRLLKPKASRSESSETYVLARGFRPPAATDVEEEEADGVSGGSGQQGAG